jgi:hypothetical protein
MHTFKSNDGRLWTVTINVWAVKRVKGLCGVDIYGLVDDTFEGVGKLLSDPCQLVDVIYSLCKEEADKLNITDEDFGRAMGGDSLEHAANAFLEELFDFFPDPRRRAGLKQVLVKMRAVESLMMASAEAEIEKIDVDSLALTLKEKSGNRQESLG